MVGRYEISNENWAQITDIVSPTQVMGRPRRDDRQVLNGIFWVLCSGAKWRDLPERYGPWSTAYERFRKWRDDGTFEAILSRLQLRLREDGLMDLDTWMIDSTSIRATRAAAGGGKKGAEEPVDHALGRSRGGLTTKIHLVCDSHGWPLAFTLSPGQQADSRHFISTLESVYLPGRVGRPRKRSRYVVADKGYDSDELRRYCDRHGIKPVIAQRQMHRKTRPGLPRRFDQHRYRQRNAVERCFGWLKELRRFATRYEKLASSFRAMVCVACIERCLRANFSYKA
ncbi:IS5 family transposase, partial [Halomonas sp. 111]|uniref:IS5 family transposase n=1 Tax=Halomonas citrativorans TaxID=2742612 RepID=A0ABR9FDH0_9GAMM|nr:MULTISPECIES: IS5 family transposase [Halomonas]MBE0404104.1 IS5 family transposase [Halomonas citrativorans]NGO90676.1 IS5 family transposase [Halomonas sp.]